MSLQSEKDLLNEENIEFYGAKDDPMLSIILGPVPYLKTTNTKLSKSEAREQLLKLLDIEASKQS